MEVKINQEEVKPKGKGIQQAFAEEVVKDKELIKELTKMKAKLEQIKKGIER